MSSRENLFDWAAPPTVTRCGGGGRKVRVLWLAVSPSSYNDALFAGLAGCDWIDLRVYYKDEDVVNSPWWAGIGTGPATRSFYRPFLGVDWRVLCAGLDADTDMVFSCSWADWTKRILLILSALRHKPYVIWVDTPANRSSFRHWLRNLYLKPVFRGACAVMGTGALALQELSVIGAPRAALINFPYWIPLPPLRPLSLPRKAGAVRFCCIGRLVPYKGFDRAIRALPQVPENGCLDILGAGPEEGSLRELARTLGVADRVRFLGSRDANAVATYLSQEPDCLLHPARELEPYGVVIIEAMAHSLAVIATTSCGAAVDRIRDGENGFLLVGAAIERDLAERMRRLCRDATLLESLGRAARVTAEEWPLSRAYAIVHRLCFGEAGASAGCAAPV